MNPKNRKLTAETAKQLWDMRGKLNQRERAEMFGVSVGLIASIDAGFAWNHVTGQPRRVRSRDRLDDAKRRDKS